MNPVEILTREHNFVRQKILMLEEMTYSPSVNTRDFSEVFRKLSHFWDMHEEKEEKILQILHSAGYKVSIEKVFFDHGVLRNYRKEIIEAILSGNETKILHVIKTTCGELIDILRAHMLIEENLIAEIHWDKMNKETLEKIQLLQIIPSDDLL